MLDPRELFTLDADQATAVEGRFTATPGEVEAGSAEPGPVPQEHPGPVVRGERGERGPVLLHQLNGFVDAGQAGRLLTRHILNTMEHHPVAVFDHDQLHDYRSRRPTMLFDANTWKSVDEFSLVLHRVLGPDGDFLLLAGPEPDTQWERYCAALIMLIERFEVPMTFTGYGIPMAVPHTRPLTLTAHATDPELVNTYRSWIDRVEVPGSAVSLLQFRLGQLGRKGMGFAIHVPHYLAQSAFPPAAIELARAIGEAGGPEIDVSGLAASARATMDEIDNEMAASGEVTELVANLERAYDTMVADEQARVPSADELGAEFERYLAERDRREGGDGPRDRED